MSIQNGKLNGYACALLVGDTVKVRTTEGLGCDEFAGRFGRVISRSGADSFLVSLATDNSTWDAPVTMFRAQLSLKGRDVRNMPKPKDAM